MIWRKEKEDFWSDLDKVVVSVPKEERLVIGTDLTGHVGDGNRGDEEVIDKYGVQERNVENSVL